MAFVAVKHCCQSGSVDWGDSFERIAEIYRILYGDALLAGTYRPVLSVGTVSEAPPYILQCPQLTQSSDSNQTLIFGFKAKLLRNFATV
jgi:hypothetical protein